MHRTNSRSLLSVWNPYKKVVYSYLASARFLDTNERLQTSSGSLLTSDLLPRMDPRISSNSPVPLLMDFRSEHDQELDSLLVGPIPVGVNKFIFEADSPDLKRIPTSEILGVTVILLTCSYDGREFVRVGYYVNNEYDSEELNAEPPAKPVIERVKRNVLAEKPRVTRFAIKW